MRKRDGHFCQFLHTDPIFPVFTTDPAVWVQIIGQRGKLSLKISGLRCFRAQRPQVMFLWTAESGDLDCA